MATLTLRNVPDDIYQSLKEAAARNRRSLNQEAIAQLEQRAWRPKTSDEMLAIMRLAQSVAPGVRLNVDEVDRLINEGRE
jgi:antitoxin FitA